MGTRPHATPAVRDARWNCGRGERYRLCRGGLCVTGGRAYEEAREGISTLKAWGKQIGMPTHSHALRLEPASAEHPPVHPPLLACLWEISVPASAETAERRNGQVSFG